MAKTTKIRPERRQNSRSPLSEKVSFEISTHLASAKRTLSATGKGLESQTQDVSEGGVCLLTKEPLEASQVVKLSLPLPHVDISTPTLAEVRWVRRLSSKKLYRAGLRFLF